MATCLCCISVFYTQSTLDVFFFSKRRAAEGSAMMDWSAAVGPSDLGAGSTGVAARHRRAVDHRAAGIERDRQPPAVHGVAALGQRDAADQLGRASCRERVCPYVSISVVAVSLTQKN